MNTNQEYKLSLLNAILININIMLGAGIFINTSTLAQRAGMLGAFMYILVGVLMLPLILSIVQLLRIHPAGGFYSFAQKELNPFMGFLSGWSYFIAKGASCMLMIHVSVMLLQDIFPALNYFHTFVLDIFTVCFFCALNLLNIKTGSTIQKMFIGFKTFPIFFAIASGFYLVQSDHFALTQMKWEGVSSSLPLVIYAVVGFEAACSMSSKIKNAQKNAPLAVLISFGIVILIATLYQALFYGALGQTLVNCANHCEVFPALVKNLFAQAAWTNKLNGILHIAIASSTLGAAYGIIFSNVWNLHILAQNNHLLFSKYLAQFNRNLIPYICVILEGLLCLTYLAVSQGSFIPLQQIGALGCVIAYTLSVGALLKAIRNNPLLNVSRALPIFGLASCSILMLACIRSFFINGMSSLVIYSTLIIFGISMFLISARKPVSTHEES